MALRVDSQRIIKTSLIYIEYSHFIVKRLPFRIQICNVISAQKDKKKQETKKPKKGGEGGGGEEKNHQEKEIS